MSKPALHIYSRSNPRVKEFLKHRDRYYWFEGEKLVRDILKKRLDVKLLVLLEGTASPSTPLLKAVREHWTVSAEVMKKLSTLKEPPAAVALLEPAVLEKPLDFSRCRVVVALDNVQDPANAGSVFRCAAAFDVDAVVFSAAAVKPTNPKFLRAAQDSFFHVPFRRFTELREVIDHAREAGLHIYLTSSHEPGRTLLPEEIDFPCLIVLGNEGRGIDPSFFQHHPSVRIAQTGQVESLNAGVSACIIMRETFKERNRGST